MRNKKKNKYLLLLILLLGISIGYAALSTTLKINGSASITKNNWSVYWANPVVTQGSVTTNLPVLSAESGSTLNTIATWTTTLNLPGDFYEFTIDAVNNGSIGAMITGIEPTVTPPLESYIKYTVTYDDGMAIEEGHLLPKKTGNTATVQKYKVRVEFLNTVTPAQMNAIPDGGLSYAFNYHIVYAQATDDAVDPHAPPKAVTFAEDSWETIVANARYNKSVYNVGDTKTIQMDLDGNNVPETYTLRVANNTTPAECATQGFSQSACGFVIEFRDIIATHKMNPKTTSGTEIGTGSRGGWEASDVRAYINSGKYLEGTADEVDYATSGIYNKLPQEIKDAIIDTTVVSARGNTGESNFVTTDRLYLLDAREIYGEGFFSHTASDSVRQLDYYSESGVTTTDYTGARKKLASNSNYYQWWTRTPFGSSFFYVGDDHSSWGYAGTSYAHGVSPAFRIAE